MRRLSGLDMALPVAVAGCAAVAMAAFWRAGTAAQAWLPAYLFWAGLPVGALYLVLVYGLTGGGWGSTLRPALAAMLRTMPLTALFLAPVLLGARHVYPGSQGWLDRPFFAARAVVYVVLWNAIASGAMRRAGPDGALSPGFAWPALILLFTSTSLAAFDWLMTLEPGWTSTIFGLLVGAGWVLGGVAAAVAITARLSPTGAAEMLDAPAAIMLTLVLLWAYFATVQLIVVWESDLSREIPWYLRRLAGGWEWAAAALAVFEFALPFLILVWRPLRRSRAAVSLAAASILLAHLIETWWLTVPDFGRRMSWIDPLAMAAVGAAFVFVAVRNFDPDQALLARLRDGRL
jgi:hypothetical protein